MLTRPNRHNNRLDTYRSESFGAMKLSTLLLSAASLGGAIPTGPSYGAIYIQDNNPRGTSVIAVRVGQDGLLSAPVRTPTGGKGLFALQDGSPPPTGELCCLPTCLPA